MDKMKCWVLVLVFISLTLVHSSQDFSCDNLKAQESLDITKLMGKWYVVEILEHSSQPTESTTATTRWVLDKCPIIRLRSTDLASVRLLWTEDSGDLDYTFKVENYRRKPGIWRSVALQNGTLSQKSYTQFAGTVHVMKAVSQHIVLTFCTESPGNNLYSLILGREHILPKSQIKGIHSLLERRELHIIGTRSTCAKGGASSSLNPTNINILFCLTTLIALVRHVIPFFNTNHLQ